MRKPRRVALRDAKRKSIVADDESRSEGLIRTVRAARVCHEGIDRAFDQIRRHYGFYRGLTVGGDCVSICSASLRERLASLRQSIAALSPAGELGV
jgi:hypothetical protein